MPLGGGLESSQSPSREPAQLGPLPYPGRRSQVSGTAPSPASLRLLLAAGWRDLPSGSTQHCGLGAQHTQTPTPGLSWPSPLACGHHGAAGSTGDLRSKKPAAAALPWPRGWEGPGVACPLPWVPCVSHRPRLSLEMKPSPAQGEQPGRSWLLAPRSPAQTRCDCASDSAEWIQPGTGSPQ